MGGFRHYSFELDLFSYRLPELFPALALPVLLVERALLLTFLLAVFIPERKSVHFVAYAMMMVLDTFFNNWVAFQNSLVISHQFPLLCGLLLHFRDSEKAQKRTLLVFLHLIGAGFVISGISKVATGWLDLSESVTYGYLLQFNHGYGVNYYLSDFFVGIDSIAFWKLTDYLVVLFELSFLINLVTFRYYKWLLVLAVIFHALVLAILNIGIFYPQILMYLLILLTDAGDRSMHYSTSSKWPIGFGVAFTALIVAWMVFHVQPFLISVSPNWVYDHAEAVINLLLMLIFVIAVTARSNRPSLFVSDAHDKA